MSRLMKPPKDSLYSVINLYLNDLLKDEKKPNLNSKISMCSKSTFQDFFTTILKKAAPLFDIATEALSEDEQDLADNFRKLTFGLLLRYSTLRQPYVCTDLSVSKDLEALFREDTPMTAYVTLETDNVCTYVDMPKQSLKSSNDSSDMRVGILFIDLERARSREFYSSYVEWALCYKLQEIFRTPDELRQQLYLANPTHLVYRIQYAQSRKYVVCELANVLFHGEWVEDSQGVRQAIPIIPLWDNPYRSNRSETRLNALGSIVRQYMRNSVEKIEESVAEIEPNERKQTLEFLLAQRELALEIDVAIKAVLTYRYGDFRGETKNFSTGFDKQRASQPKKTRSKKSKQKAKTPKPYAVTYLQSAELPWETANSVEAALEQEVNSLNADLQKQTPNTPNHYKKIWVVERYLKTHRIPESDVYLVDENRPRRNRYGEQVFKTRYLIKRLFIYDANSTDAPLDSAKVHVKRLTLKSLAKEDIDKGEGEGASPL